MKVSLLTLCVFVIVLLGAPAPARAQRLQLFGEVRLSAIGAAASTGLLGPGPVQLGQPPSPQPCGPVPRTDFGGALTGTGVALLEGNHYRYQLGLSAGYFAFLCTPSLKRPVGGLDFRGEHHFGDRTVLTTTLHGTLDSFDRSLDLRSGVLDAVVQGTQLTGSGKPYLSLAGTLEVEHNFTGSLGLHAGLATQAVEILAPFSQFSSFATLGSMEAAEVTATPFLLRGPGGRERFDLTARYQISHYFAASQSDVIERWQLPATHDGSLAFGWEHRLSLFTTLRLEGGAAVAYQPALCVPPTPGSGDCSIDHAAPGIRGSIGAPPLEVQLSRKNTGTFVGQVVLRRGDRDRIFEAQLFRGYEPNY